jgi:hypothetical protein
MLNRTITITGSDFSSRYKPIPPPPWPNPNVSTGVWPTPWSPWANSTHPVEGLHVLAVGRCSDGSANGADCQSAGGFLAVRYTRVEKAGQVRVGCARHRGARPCSHHRHSHTRPDAAAAAVCEALRCSTCSAAGLGGTRSICTRWVTVPHANSLATRWWGRLSAASSCTRPTTPSRLG